MLDLVTSHLCRLSISPYVKLAARATNLGYDRRQFVPNVLSTGSSTVSHRFRTRLSRSVERVTATGVKQLSRSKVGVPVDHASAPPQPKKTAN
jgi:hypothetical protein